MPLHLTLVAGEASGDALGARLIAALRAHQPGITVSGVGGPLMAAQGLTSWFPFAELALMGFLEVLPRLRHLAARLTQTSAAIAAQRPDAVITIDSPGFTFRLLRRIAPLGIPRIHYVAPQVWAWRPGRVRHYPGLWDQLLCLLPFEPAFFARHQLPARFTGHPVLESAAGAGDAARFRARHFLGPEERVLLLLPGSRATETGRLLPIMAETLARLAPAHPGLRPVIPLAPPVAAAVRQATRAWPLRPLLVEAEDKPDAFAAAAAALSKSGTATLELALAGVPMLVAYRVNPLTAALARRLVTVSHASILNLLGPPCLPEFIQERCTPELLAPALARLLADPEAAAEQLAGVAAALAQLRPPDGLAPSEAAAEAVLETISSARSRRISC
jgi:lipid-A-disaccharide synthase